MCLLSAAPSGSSARERNRRVIGLLVALVPNVGDAWAYTLDALGRYFERVLAQKPDAAVANRWRWMN